MALVGDVIIAVREKGPDPPSYLGVPSLTVSTTAGSGTLIGDFYFVFTATSPWGESAPTAEVHLNVPVAGRITFSVNILPPGATGYRIYWATAPNGQNGFIIGDPTMTLVLNMTPTLIGGVPPVGPTAMLPETDGQFVNAFTVYRWLNDALKKAGRIGGGVPDSTGIQAVAGNAMYRIPGRWIRFTNGWFDAWPIMFGRKSDVFLRNTFQGISGLFTTEQWTATTTVFQLWPQPNRTGAATTLSVTVNATGTSLVVASVTGFLPIGFVQVDNEIMQYSGINSGTNTLTGLVRGMGGTQAVSHTGVADGTPAPVTELNIRLSGFRQPNEYAPGDSLKTLDVPLGWEEPIQDYVLAQYRKAEQDTAQAQQLEKSFENAINVFAKASRTQNHPRQMGDSEQLVIFPGTFLGGVLVP